MKFNLFFLSAIIFFSFSCSKSDDISVKTLELGTATAEISGDNITFNTASGAFNPALKSFSIALNGTPTAGGTSLITTVAINLTNFKKGDLGIFPCVEKTSGTSTQAFGTAIQTTLTGSTGGVITGGTVEFLSWSDNGVNIKFQTNSKGSNSTISLTKGVGNIKLLN